MWRIGDDWTVTRSYWSTAWNPNTTICLTYQPTILRSIINKKYYKNGFYRFYCEGKEGVGKKNEGDDAKAKNSEIQFKGNQKSSEREDIEIMERRMEIF